MRWIYSCLFSISHLWFRPQLILSYISHCFSDWLICLLKIWECIHNISDPRANISHWVWITCIEIWRVNKVKWFTSNKFCVLVMDNVRFNKLLLWRISLETISLWSKISIIDANTLWKWMCFRWFFSRKRWMMNYVMIALFSNILILRVKYCLF